MAQDDKRGEARAKDAPTDEATRLKKQARRRLIGAVALALLAAVVLPMVMDHQPATTLKDIQVRIPSPDEGVTQRIAPRPAEPAPSAAAPATAEPVKPVAKTPPAPPPAPLETPPTKPEARPTVPETRPPAPAQPSPPEQWEVQLGAYQNPASVANLVRRLQELGLPTYTEKIDTPNGPRTRVRAGPFPTQEAAERARSRVKIIGVDGPVARKP